MSAFTTKQAHAGSLPVSFLKLTAHDQPGVALIALFVNGLFVSDISTETARRLALGNAELLDWLGQS